MLGIEQKGERALPVEAPPGGQPVPPVLVDHVVAGELTEPEVKRQGRVAEVLGEPLTRTGPNER